MKKTFSKEDADKIAQVLGAEEPKFVMDHFRLEVVDEEDSRKLILELFPEVTLGRTRGMLAVVYTGNSHLQLHNCTGYVVSNELGEVTFVTETPEHLSGLVIERGASCSLYASLNRDLISSDFTQLGVEVMLSGVALSLVEDILGSDQDSDK